jgi:bacterioferritin-associated ferredoxin
MIVCSCNVLTDHDVRRALTSEDALPRNVKQVLGCLGCSAECGRCARTIITIAEEALGACLKGCHSRCAHREPRVNRPVYAEPALAASRA